MKLSRIVLAGVALIGLAAAGSAQTWSRAYDTGLKAARALRWMEARQAFQQAAAYRPEDQSGPTTLPGPVTEQRRWRNGAPYSPNFLAAYAGYRIAMTMTGAEQTEMLDTVAREFRTLVEKGQVSRETVFFLDQLYTRLGQVEAKQQLQARLASASLDFKIDLEPLAADDLAQINASIPATAPVAVGGGQAPPITVLRAGDPSLNPAINPTSTGLPNVPVTIPVAQAANKYALIIGNSEGRSGEQGIPFAADDAQKVREALVFHAGYAESNIDLVLNATAQQILTSARALADRVPEGGAVMIFFSGVGFNIAGKDYMAGIDADASRDLASLVAKNDLYRLFMARGARIFAFYQVNRPVVEGRFFGQEVPMVGSISQAQATLPGETVASFTKGGKEIGIYTDAFAGVLAEIRSNRIPISEFGW